MEESSYESENSHKYTNSLFLDKGEDSKSTIVKDFNPLESGLTRYAYNNIKNYFTFNSNFHIVNGPHYRNHSFELKEKRVEIVQTAATDKSTIGRFLLILS